MIIEKVRRKIKRGRERKDWFIKFFYYVFILFFYFMNFFIHFIKFFFRQVNCSGSQAKELQMDGLAPAQEGIDLEITFPC